MDILDSLGDLIGSKFTIAIRITPILKTIGWLSGVQGPVWKVLFKMCILVQDLPRSSQQVKKIKMKNPLQNRPWVDWPFGAPHPSWPSLTFPFTFCSLQ